MSWYECVESEDVLKVTPDKSKAKSLVSTAKARIKFFEKQVINEDNCSFFLEAYYSSVIELLHSIVIIKGFKIKNHICLGFYLKDILKREDLFQVFDINRKRRNALVYYGELIKFETAKKAINELKTLIKELEA